MVRNLPPGMTERYVKEFFAPYLDKVGIHTYHCHKPRGKTFAKLTLTDTKAGKLFLELHGQTEPGREGFASVKVKLFHFRKPVNISESYHAPDKFLLSSLASEEKRITTTQTRKAKGAATKPTELQRAFNIRQICCGHWGYSNNKLAFFAHFREDRNGRVIFGRRSIVIQLDSNVYNPYTTASHQIEILYGSVESFTTGTPANPTITFSLAEAPKLFENAQMQDEEASLATAMQRTTLQYPGPVDRNDLIKRIRITALGKSHEIVVSSCLCYRFTVTNPQDFQAIQALKYAREIPQIIAWGAPVIGSYSFSAQMTHLNNALAGGKFGQFSFGLKFQLQRLAQNGYLPPTTVVPFMDAVASHSHGVSAITTTRAVRRLLGQIPFAGPDTEASDLSLQKLSDLLVQNQQAVAREDSYSSAHVQRPEHICDIYKATVTPAGIYLHGPEPEIKNRILRKYSDYTDYFLQVSFYDENEEPIRYERYTSNDGIFHGRFKKILEGVINIAGRGYEFLGFSHSSLRSQTCYFMAPFTMGHEFLHARAVIARLGDFSQIRSPAKCAARSKLPLEAVVFPDHRLCLLITQIA